METEGEEKEKEKKVKKDIVSEQILKKIPDQ